MQSLKSSQGDQWCSCGFSVVNGEVGFGTTVTVRGNDQWSFGFSGGVSNGQTVGKLQFRFAN